MVLIDTMQGTRRNFTQRVNFYDEVRRFEISLIEQALRQTNGSQVRAAVLLGMKHTTLNSKIKSYSICHNGPPRSNTVARSLSIANE